MGILEHSEIAREFQEETKRLLAKEWTLEQARNWHASGPALQTIWTKIDDLGAFNSMASEDNGGLGLGLGEVMGVFEEAGYALVPGPLVENVVIRHWLPTLGTTVSDGATLALVWQQGLLQDQAAKDIEFSDGRLSGVANAVEYGAFATELLVVASHAEHRCLVLVQCDAPGLMREPYGLPDIVSSPAKLTFDGVAGVVVSDIANLVDEFLARLVAVATLTTAAELVGLTRHLVDLSVAYAKERVQFDRTIGSFQAIQHILAEMFVDSSIASTMLAVIAEQNAQHVEPASSWSLKWFSGTVAKRTSEQALQVHGGIGFADEFPLGDMLKRTLYLRRRWGNERMHAIALGERSLALSQECHDE